MQQWDSGNRLLFIKDLPIHQTIINHSDFHATAPGLKAAPLREHNGLPLSVKYMPSLQYRMHDPMHGYISVCVADMGYQRK